jgi:hypothetical protein
MIEHDQGIQDPKRRGRDNEHVDRHRVSQVAVQEAAPPADTSRLWPG